MKIAVLYNHVPDEAGPEDQDTLVQAAAVEQALGRLGHKALRVPCTLSLDRLKAALVSADFDLAFNLVEGLDGHGRLIHLVPDLLESLSVPFTGAAAEAMYLTSNKVLAKRLMLQSGLPTPDWFCAFGPGNPGFSPRGRFIVKSVWEHASFGMGDDAVFDSSGEADVVSALRRKEAQTSRPFLAERFVDGREFNISVLAGPDGPEVLPIAEMDFSAFPDGRHRIVDYRAKWAEGTFEYENTSRVFRDPGEEPGLLETLRKVTLRCWSAFGLRGYARVDFRVDRDGSPWVLEVNANPCISPDAGFAAALSRAKIPYEDAIRRIVEDAPRRGRPGSPLKKSFVARAGELDVDEDGFTVRDRVAPGDPERIGDLVARTGFFSAEEVSVAVELAIENAARGPESGYDFLLVEKSGKIAGYACFGPVPCTALAFDLYWIAVEPSLQGAGLGRAIFDLAEKAVRRQGGTRIYADTSGRPQYTPTRSFYERLGFDRECEQADFYGPGDSRVLYCKVLH